MGVSSSYSLLEKLSTACNKENIMNSKCVSQKNSNGVVRCVKPKMAETFLLLCIQSKNPTERRIELPTRNLYYYPQMCFTKVREKHCSYLSHTL
jgi:hypothetical protein